MAEVIRNDNINTLHAELKRLATEHEALEAKLSRFDVRLYLTRDQEFERKTLQKLKLRTKDRIRAINLHIAV